MSRQQATVFQKSKTLDDKYLIGDEIGKGAYGRVQKAVNLVTGDFVAIKQISLENIPKDDLSSIMSEIELLKNLNHRNIVRYIGSSKSASHLHIILEFVENGSLANIVKPNKFGPFPEDLVAIYIAQVLEGLAYLHEQGVIHRDIKGANILATKEGIVKLADFGVATKLTEADGDALSVVGTPYWMAPEVIEMSGVAPAADIWSVGCTAIELLTSVPPFYDLQPMSALFRIVKDDMPPLPDNLSPEFEDFLRKCFRKLAKMRPPAVELLKHPWIVNSLNKAKNPSPCSEVGTPRPIEISEEVPDTTEKEQVSGRAPDGPGQEGSSQEASTKPEQAENAAQRGDSSVLEKRETIPESLSGRVDSSKDKEKNDSSTFTDVSLASYHSRNSSLGDVIGFSSVSLERRMSDVSGLSRFQDTENDKLISDLFQGCVAEAKATGRAQNGIGGMLRERLKQEFSSQQKPLDLMMLAAQFKDLELETGNKEMIDEVRRSIEMEAKVGSELSQLLESLRSPNEETLIKTCEKLMQLFKDYPIRKGQLYLLQPAISPLMDVVEGEYPRVIWTVLKLMNQISKECVEFRELICMAGLVPVLLALASAKRSRPEIRLEAARLIRRFCFGSTLTLRMLVGCRAIPTIVAFLETDFIKCRELVFAGVDSLSQLLLMPEPTATSNLLLSLTRSGLLTRLLTTMQTLCGVIRAAPSEGGNVPGQGGYRGRPGAHAGGMYLDNVSSAREASKFYDSGHLPEASVISPGHKAGSSPDMAVVGMGKGGSRKGEKPGQEAASAEHVCLERASGILLLMSRGDPPVKIHFCSQVLLTRLLDLLDRVDQNILVKLLECLKHLALDASCLEVLQRTDVIRKLVWMLKVRDGPRVNEIHTQALSTLYSLCKINKRGQEIAAESGLIPHLVAVIPTPSPLRQFALPLLCDMAHASRPARALLVQAGAPELYLLLLEDPVWAPHALDALSMLLVGDSEQRAVEKVMLRKEAIDRVVGFFRACPGPTFPLILEPFLRMMTRSLKLNAALANSGFLPLVVARLDDQDAVVRLNVLKMIKAVYDNHSSPKQLVLEHDLPRKLKRLTEEKREGERGGGQVLVKQMASVLLRGLHMNQS